MTEQSRAQAYWLGFGTADKAALELKSREYASAFGCEFVGVSSWFEAGCIRCELSPPRNYPGLDWIQELGKYQRTAHAIGEDSLGINGHSRLQLGMLGLDSFHKEGYTGLGVRLALFDAGFENLDSLAPFEELRNGRLLVVKDFVDGDTDVYDAHPHGMQVLSIAGIYYPDSLIGAAPGATFILARTEDAGSETHLEEFNWVAALEWADSIGVDIIHSSLGYSVFDTLQGDYKYADMDGKSTIITKAAEMAYSRGIFITNSAGNEGAKPWFYITAPCDGPNVLCVGALDSFEQVADFSSRGPSADGRVKPDVMAMGRNTSFLHTDGYIRRGNGTSFSGPIIAGMVACLKQKWPDTPNDRLLRAIRMSGDRYTNPDSAYGFGLPNVWRVDSILNEMLSVEETIPNSETVLIYPNPAREEIRLRAAHGILSVRILDMAGRVLIETGSVGYDDPVDLTLLPAGMYRILLQLESGDRFGQKLILIR
ncbi:MAG: S8 family serine peptidase [Flavobacteriales bacterium]|nr:S8 family serine peptidase [Flavobacteriales bacterium]